METPLEKKIEELINSTNHVWHLKGTKEKVMQELASWCIEQVKMDGIEAKMTPFQETVTTYIKNKATSAGIKE